MNQENLGKYVIKIKYQQRFKIGELSKYNYGVFVWKKRE
jgi:hypothetical protein